MKNIVKMIAMIAAVFCVALAVPGSVKAADSIETTRHYFTQTTSTQKITWFVEGEKVVATASFGGRNLDYSKHYYEMKNDYTGLYFYRLKTDRSGIEKIPVYRDKVYTLQNGEWVLTYDGSESGYVSYSDLTYNTQYYDFTDSGIDILEFNMTDRGTAFNKGTGTMDYKSVNHSTEANIYSYLLNGTFTDFGKNYVFLLHENLLDIVPQMYRSSSTLTNSTVSISVDYDEENGIVSWSDFVVDEENTLKKGVIAAFYYSGDKGYNTDYYRTILTGTSYKISLGGCDFSDSTMRYRQITFIPYYIHTNGTLYFGKSSYITIDEDSVAATRSASSLLTQVKSSTSSGGVLPDKAQGSGGSEPSDFQYDSSIPVPRLRFTGTLNFYIENASDDYFVEIQGRHYTVDDIELFKQNLLWKYKYSTVLKNDLSVWVDVQRRKLSRGNFDLLDLGSESFENLLLSYPIENRNYYGGSNALGNYLSGYSDALSQLKTVLLPVPGTLLNGTEIYIRFYTIDDQNTCHYGKWCHWYDNMGDPDGSSASQWDDKENMFTENQSESGLTDSAKDQIEESGYSKSDSDVSSSYNNTSSWDSKASDSVFSVISSIVSSLGAFPNLIAKVCSFLPDWTLILIGVGIGFVVLLRFVGR